MRNLLAGILVALMAGSSALADIKEIGWADLVPEHPSLVNPLQGVEIDVLEDLGTVARVKLDVKQGFISEDSAEVIEINELIASRLAEGVDLRAINEAVAEYEAELIRRQAMTNPVLDGMLVKIPGYALPLEYSGQGATELFLVPFVGACIHVPPPPPNQILTMSLDKPMAFGGLFEPIWVTGRVKIEQASRSLSFVDGAADIPYGYRLTDVQIEPYK